MHLSGKKKRMLRKEARRLATDKSRMGRMQLIFHTFSGFNNVIVIETMSETTNCPRDVTEDTPQMETT